MDANSQPEKANPTAGSAHGRDNAADPSANIPRIESPSLAPGQDEPAATYAAAASETASPAPSTALILTIVEPESDKAAPAEEAPKKRRLPNWRLTKISSLAA